ncbi:MAG: hypothetical protein AAB426_11680 [Myxococcota bacterium]
MRWWLAPVLTLVWCAAHAAPARAQPALVFYWVDGRGDLHATDRLGDVPEPYYGMYVAKLAASEEARAKGGAPPAVHPESTAPLDASVPAPPSQPSIVEQTIAQREGWKKTVREWRQELERATTALRDATTALEQAELNPILRETSAQQQVIERARSEQQAALVGVEKARRMLLEDIPKRARAEHVPPKWLE